MKPLFEYISRAFENATPANTTGMGDVNPGSKDSVGSDPPPTDKKKKPSTKKKCKKCKEEE